jgi:biopolymer transport protein ExbD
LAQDARFNDIVATVSALEPSQQPGQRCLLGTRNKKGFHLGAEFASALYPLPKPPEDLDAALKRAPVVRVLSRWGQYGQGNVALALAAITEAPPTRGAFSVVLTDQGAYVRASDPQQPILGAAIEDEQLVKALARADAFHDHNALFVSAEANVAVARLLKVLSALSRESIGPVALAVALPPGTPIPAPAAERASPALCPNGLPELEGESGELELEAIQTALIPFRERAATCLEQADARGAAGGRLRLAIRVEASGRVGRSCIEANETEDDALSACVIAATQQLTFPAPQPAGRVDLSLPIVLLQSSNPAQAPVCSPLD